MSNGKLASHPGGTPLGYMPQLDGLRALAVVGIWFVHWGIAQEPYFRCVEWGRLAVWMFFVLSGFLITGILYKSKNDVEAGKRLATTGARIFYARRLLRILPIYYLTIFATALMIPDVRRLFWWHLTFTTDFWATLNHHEYPWGIHFWTLAVEEQFYLTWPWLVLLLPRKRIVGFLLALCGCSLAYRAVVHLAGLSTTLAVALPLPLLGNVDKFGLGALLATFRANHDVRGERRLIQVGLFIGLPLMLFFEVLQGRAVHLSRPQDTPVYLAFASTTGGMFFVWVVARASIGFGGVGRVLALRPVIFMGKMSYSVYLFHMFVPPILWRVTTKLHIPLPPGVWERFFVYASVTLAAGTASWYLIESPINSLKRRFKVAPQERTAMPAPAPVMTT
ncbi:MAG TPA: acyltransferase [Tepidisphaeraceae bacterium]|nr:acyltransferase [Tepidisphaeraceae bacterium]